MKPSERIIQIVKEDVKKDTQIEYPFENWERLEELSQIKLQLDLTAYISKATLQYLDEEHEKNKPCEHEPGDVSINGMRECKKCHILTS